MPHRHKTHQIDELAQQVFRATIPTTWVYNEQKIDYGKDYLVEIGGSNDKLTGQHFFVQLRGKTKVSRFRKTKMKCRLKTKHAEYYADKIKDLPVFLVLVDVTKRQAWYLFLQPYLLKDQSWRKNKDVTVYLPEDNDLANTSRFCSAVEEAIKVMRRLHPLSIPEAMQSHKQHMQERDPRFLVNILASTKNEVRYEFIARTPVKMTMRFKGHLPTIQKKIFDLYVLGCGVDVASGELTITGTPLLEPVAKLGGHFQLATNIQGAATTTLICKDKDGAELTKLDIPGQLKLAPSGCCFEGWLGPIMKLNLGPFHNGKTVVRSPLDLRKWDGQHLLNLAYFDKVFALCRALPDTVHRVFNCELQGNSVCTITVKDERDEEQSKNARAFVELLGKARSIASKVGVNPIWKMDALQANMETIGILYPLLFESGYVVPAPNYSHRITREKEECAGLEDQWEGSMAFGEYGLFDFFSQEINVGNISIIYENVSVTIQQSKEGYELVDILIQGNEETMFRICREEPEDGSASHEKGDAQE